MKPITVLSLVLMHLTLCAQNKISPTNEINILGEIQNEIKVTVSDLLQRNSIKIDDIVITNHLGEKKGPPPCYPAFALKTYFRMFNLMQVIQSFLVHIIWYSKHPMDIRLSIHGMKYSIRQRVIIL